jgi:hypothetical protein
MISEFDQQCYGCDIQDFISQIKSSASYKLGGAGIIVAGLMSDAQEEIAMGADERARQSLNRAKAILFEIMEGKMILEVPR